MSELHSSNGFERLILLYFNASHHENPGKSCALDTADKGREPRRSREISMKIKKRIDTREIDIW